MNDAEANNERNAISEMKQESMFSWQCEMKDAKKLCESKRKLVTIGILTVIMIVLSITLVSQMVIYCKGDYNEICQSEECVKTAVRIMDAMNRSVDPCQDFYEFACGGWISRNPIPHSQTSWDQLSVLREQLLKDLRILLEKTDEENDLRPVKLARALYRTCMNITGIEALGMKPVYEMFDRLELPKDPFAQNETLSFDLPDIVGRIQRVLGLNVFLNFYISEDIRDTAKNKMMIEQTSPGFNERYLLDSLRFQTELTEYKDYIKNMIELAGVGNRSIEFANEILNFSKNVARIMESPEQRRSVDHLVYDITIDELQQLTDLYTQQWNWTKYFEAVFNNTNVTINTTLDHVVVMDLEYLQKLPKLLAITPFTTIVCIRFRSYQQYCNQNVSARFVWWNVYSTIAPLTLQQFRDLGFKFSQKVFGLKEETPRWKACTGNVNANFGMALSYIYAQEHFDDRARQEALEMLFDIKAAFEQMIAELDWMDANTRARAHAKLRAIRPFVGIPDWINNSEKLNKFYEGINIIPGKLFETFLLLIDAATKKSLNSLREKPNKNRWISTGTTVNAFYSAILNSVTFPAGILHPPFYGNGLQSINYGAMGAIMGHELTHGFDDQGRRYDQNGNLRQWWSNETLRHYHEKVQCIIQQYSNYHLPELADNFTVNGVITQGENIADNGGIREAYKAYQRFKKRNTDRLVLPGLVNYSQEQLFFVGFAQVWCGSYTDGALKSKLIQGVHAPNHFRVIGTLSNNADFARAWNCRAESSMNPSRKCVLW
ncbi:neprilysin-4-like isoform X3 [Frieseomelitta varia]|nr:neprilysin-4-like isoform X3 [Frieseomelitta varia]XP_043506310.1 neprilysin-4-like isoform X3 [Frieseomelitta varia]XP_043506311.1 neprilysin-4-like isoform X3 [Frieseomelitta varia]XP_043506312.1 neprilysin-4-like isoform X3 [Frieseomelitta varia]